MNSNGSPVGRLNGHDLRQVGKNALLVTTASLVTHLSTEIVPLLQNTSYVWAIPIILAVLQMFGKLITDTRNKS